MNTIHLVHDKKEQWKYIYRIFPFIDIPFSVLILIYSKNWLVTLCFLIVLPLIALSILKLSEKKEFQAGPYIFLINGTLFFFFAYFSGPESPTWLMMINITIGSSFMYDNPRIGQIVFTIYLILLGLFYYWMGASVLYSLIITCSLLAFLGLFSIALKYMQFLQIRLENKTKETELQKNEIISSITYAKRIQEATLPSEGFIKECFPEIFILHKPKDIVAGDFYWIEKTNDLLYFSVADCTGHGVPGAMMSLIGVNGLNKSLKQFNLRKPSSILDNLNQSLEETFEKGNNEVKDGMDIALCCLNLKEKKLEYSGANNSLYHISTEGVLKEIKSDRQPIGKFEGRKPFTNHTIDVKKGDLFIVFTDGFADQFGGKKGKKFKYKPFKELLLANYHKPLEVQKQLLNETIEKWKGNLEQVDDICVVGVRIS